LEVTEAALPRQDHVEIERAGIVGLADDRIHPRPRDPGTSATTSGDWGEDGRVKRLTPGVLDFP